MKHMTLKEIRELQDIINGRTLRMKNLTKMLKNGVKKSDYDWIKKEIHEHEVWIKQQEAVIRKFFAPAA